MSENPNNEYVAPHFEDMTQETQVENTPVVLVQPQQNYTDCLGIASMILGIVSVVICCCYGLGILLAVPGLILGICAKKNPNTGNKSCFAIAGIIISAISILLNICWLIYMLWFIFSSGAVDSNSDFNDIISQYEKL